MLNNSRKSNRTYRIFTLIAVLACTAVGGTALAQGSAFTYTKLTMLMLQAIKELKTENDQRRELIKQQQSQIESLKKIICQGHPSAEACR